MHRITLLPAGRTFTCAEGETILDAAFREHIQLPHGCRSGGCGSCKTRIMQGEIDDSDASPHALMDFERAAGLTLLCSAYALSDVVVWSDQWEEGDATTTSRDLKASVIETLGITHNMVMVRLLLAGGEALSFKAGQYVELKVPHTEEWRAYSIANPPSSANRLELLVRLINGGLFSDYLAAGKLRSGDSVDLRGPFGSFSMHESSRPILFVAGGSGLAPVLSMLRQMAENSEVRRPVRLLYGARKRCDLCFVDELRCYEAAFADLRFVPVLSEADDDPDWQGERGLVTEALEQWCNGGDVQAYLCGPPAMIDSALPLLARLGVPSQEIYFDKFLTRADLSVKSG